MKPIITVVYVLMALVVGLGWVAYSYVSQIGIDMVPRISSRRYQVVTARAQVAMGEGNEAWQQGDLKTAEARFKWIINDKTTFPSKPFYVKLARAKLAKLYKQEGRSQISPTF